MISGWVWLKKFPDLTGSPSTFRPISGHHLDEVCILQKYNIVFYSYWCILFLIVLDINRIHDL